MIGLVRVVVTFRNLKDCIEFETEFEFDDINCATDFIKDITLYNCTPIVRFTIESNKLKLKLKEKESDGKKVK